MLQYNMNMGTLCVLYALEQMPLVLDWPAQVALQQDLQDRAELDERRPFHWQSWQAKP